MFSQRIERLQKFILSEKLDSFLIENPIDLFYLTGLRVSCGKLFVDLKQATIFVDGRYFEKVKDSSSCQAVKISPESLRDFFSTKPFNILGFDETYMSYQGFHKLVHFLDKSEAKITLKGLDNPIRGLRLIKDSQEIAFMRKAAQLNWRGFEHVCSLLKDGVSEKMLATEFEIFCKKNGADGLAFDPIVAFGAHTAIPHHTSSSKTLGKDDIVLIDCGVKVDGYCSDMTRVIFWGKPNPELEKIYAIVRRAHNKALSLCRAGMHIRDLTRTVKEYIVEEGYEKNFLHGIGHGVGLEIHELPKLGTDINDLQTLKAGMTFTIEPGIYLEGIGGVRYEDTLLITQNGYENFYTS